MTIAEAGQHIINSILKRYDQREATQIASILLEDVYGITNVERNDIFSNAEDLEDDISRLLSGEPIQYITGVSHFFGYKFGVNKHVLIPRPETEELVYQVLQDVKETKKQLDVLDVGTGSGCIPITLKKEKSTLRLFAMDYSQDALNVAKSNARKLNANIVFYKFDFLNIDAWEEMGRFDVITSNPPYIALEEKELMKDNVLKFEPEMALFAGQDTLIFYKAIATFAETHLNDHGRIYLELNQYFATETEMIYKELGYTTEVIKDMQGNDRILKAYRA